MVKFYELGILISSLILQISANQEEQRKISKSGDGNFLTISTIIESGLKNHTEARLAPIFPNTYIAEGVIITPNTTINQPIKVWCDGKEGIHRLDYYDGLFTKLRVRKKNETRTYNFFPVSTETFKNQLRCTISKVQESRVDVFLPLLSNYRYCGEEIIQGVKTEKWCNETNLQKETVYIQSKNSTNKTQGLISVPLMIKKDAYCYSQHIHFTNFSDSNPNTTFMAEPLKKGLKCMNSNESEEYSVQLNENNTAIYGEHKVELSLQPGDYLNLPDALDWRDRGAVSEVKDQGEDGPCWSFATTGIIESAYLIRTNGTQMLDLSEQALLDCSWGFGSTGHFGGDQISAFKWIIKHGGIPTEQQYGPYLAKSGFCHADKVNLTVPISGWGQIETNSSEVVKAGLKRYGPLAVVIDGYTESFTKYSKSTGIYNDRACKTKLDEMNHVVLLVGYGKQNGTEYWIIKNSWGINWGNQGYAYIAINNNTCGLMNHITYVVI